MIKKFAYFKNCVYLCTQKHFTVFLSFFDIFLFQRRFPNQFCLNVLLQKKNFENIVQILRMIFKRILKIIFEKKVQSKKRSKRNLFLFLFRILFLYFHIKSNFSFSKGYTSYTSTPNPYNIYHQILKQFENFARACASHAYIQANTPDTKNYLVVSFYQLAT